MTTATDTFQRANGALGASWTDWSWSGSAGAQIASLAATGGNAGTTGDYWNASAFTNDQSSTVTIGTVPPSGSWTGVTVRTAGTGEGYLALWFQGAFFLFNENGTASPPQLGSGSVSGTLTTGDTLSISAVGTTVTVSHNGTPVITVTDSTYATGKPGIAFFGTGQSVTSWTGADVIPPVTVSATSLPNVVQGVPARCWVNAAGGVPPYAWSVSAGTLPAGLSLSSSGMISGTPSGTGASSFTIRATDSQSSSGTKSLSITSVSAPLSPGTPSTDGNGVTTWHVTSAINFNDAETIRSLPPSSPSPDYPHGYLICLPVAAGTDDTSFGNGLDTARALGLHNAYNLTVVEPSTGGAWMANNPSNAALLQETYLLQVLSWMKANLATTGTEKAWIIGFSRTGIGGLAIFLHWADLFAGVASWDYPAAMTTFDGQDPHGTVGGSSASSYGTQDNFAANYQLSPANMARWAAGQSLSPLPRVWIGGYFAFQLDVADGNANLTVASISHYYSPVAASAHNWAPTPSWMDKAVQALLGVTATAHLSASPSLGCSGSVSKTGAAHLSAPASLTAAGSVTHVAHAQAALSAVPLMTCSALSQRIRISPGNVLHGAPSSRGPLVPDPYVTVQAIDPGTFDT